jgi:hypothetical protein
MRLRKYQSYTLAFGLMLSASAAHAEATRCETRPGIGWTTLRTCREPGGAATQYRKLKQ